MSKLDEWLQELGGEIPTHSPKPYFVLPLIFSRSEVHQILGCPLLTPTESLALRILANSGIRAEELAGLTPAENRIHISGERERWVELDPETAKPLGEYAQPFTWSPQALREILLKAATWAGSAARFDGCGRVLLPSALRHAFATHRLENGMDLAMLNQLLGHESMLTTEMYLQTAVGTRSAAYASSHPLMQSHPSLRPRANPPGSPGAPRDKAEQAEALTRQPAGTPTFAQVMTMVEAAKSLRDRTMLRLLYATSLRLAELLNLCCLDIDFDERRVFVRQGKENRDRYTLVDPGTLALLQELKPNWILQDSLFHLRSEHAVQAIVEDVAGRTGIQDLFQAQGQRISPHSFRHAFATHCYLNGMPPHDLRRLLGHSDLQTTLIYLDIPPSHLQQVYDRSHLVTR